MCDFVDDGASIFPLTVLQPCMVDSWVEWAEDYKPFAMRPFGDRQVWVGYDPAETGDCSGLVVVAPPLVARGQVPSVGTSPVPRHGLRGAGQRDQGRLRPLLGDVHRDRRHRPGQRRGAAGAPIFPNVTTFSYSPEVKTRLVLKAYDVIHRGRLEFDAGWTDMAQSLMAIRKPSPPAVANSPTPPAATTTPATPTWHGRSFTHCTTNRWKGRPLPIPGGWRFFDVEPPQKYQAVGPDARRGDAGIYTAQ